MASVPREVGSYYALLGEEVALPPPKEEVKEKGGKKNKKDKKEKKGQQQAPPRELVPIAHHDDGLFGDLKRIQSAYKTDREWATFDSLTAKKAGEQVWIRARVHSRRQKGKNCFIVLRRAYGTVQCIASEWNQLPKEMVKFAGKIPPESIVDILGEVTVPENPIQSTFITQNEIEIVVKKLFVVNASVPVLPFQLDDAMRPFTKDHGEASHAAGGIVGASPVCLECGSEFATAQLRIAHQVDNDHQQKIKSSAIIAAADQLPPTTREAPTPAPEKKEVSAKKGKGKGKEEEKVVTVGMNARLDNRWVDIRTPANHAIFRVQSGVCRFFREFFWDHDYVEIHSPKIIPGVSEGGADVFRTDYFGKSVCLSQSPQLYKQMGVQCDLFNVFEIGPVFRAENSNTHRHLCEFTGMDFEMEIKEHYHEVLHMLGNVLVYIFDNLNKKYRREIDQVQKQFGTSDLKYRPMNETLVIGFPEGIEMLKADPEWTEPIDEYGDLSTPMEKRLGQLVFEKYGTEFYILDRYPVAARPFYTMVDPVDDRYTNSYDVFLRGEEITSGAQRIHEVEMLTKRAVECEIPLDGLQAYLDCMKYGAYPHGGAGIGMERVVMLFLGLPNIRLTSLFPRTPMRCTP